MNTSITRVIAKVADALHRASVTLHADALVAHHEALTLSIKVHDKRIAAQAAVVRWAQSVLADLHDDAADAVVSVAAEQSKINAELKKLAGLK